MEMAHGDPMLEKSPPRFNAKPALRLLPAIVNFLAAQTRGIHSIRTIMATSVFPVPSLSRALAGVLAILSLPALHAAISIDGFTDVTNDRFANSPNFVAASFNLSGVGRSSSGWWITMISPNVFLSAGHTPIGVGETVTFYAGNDPTSPAISATVGGTEVIGGTDVRLGYLDFPLPASITPYSYTTIQLTNSNFTSSGLFQNQVLMNGLSPTGTGYGASSNTNQAAGLNYLEGFQEDYPVGGAGVNDTLFAVHNNPGDPGYNYSSFEANLNSGDSGGPLFRINGGVLQLVGINLAVGTTTVNGQPRNISAFTYVGNYSTEIGAYVTLHAVPESSSAALAAVGGLILLRRRRGGVISPSETRS